MKPSNVFCCGICDKQFTRPSHLKRHELTHSNRREFHCSFCSQSFLQKPHLQRHLTSKHGAKARNFSETAPLVKGMSLFACLKCPEASARSFLSRWELRRHEASVHAEELRCLSCENQTNRAVIFETFAGWKSHLEYHRGRRPYLCDVCWRAFEQKIDFQNHKEGVHDKVGRKQCVVCDAVFAQRTQIWRHILRHHISKKPVYVCDSPKCSQESFDTETALKLHLRIRHRISESPHACSFCSKWFRRKLCLADHTAEMHIRKLPVAQPVTSPSRHSSDNDIGLSLSDEAEECGDEDDSELHLSELKLLVRITHVETPLTQLSLGSKLPEFVVNQFPQLAKLDIETREALGSGTQVRVNVPLYDSDCESGSGLLKSIVEIDYP